MMKKTMMILVLVLAMLTATAQADSILPTVTKSRQQTTISFGVTVGADPVSSRTNALTGLLTEVYENVTGKQYDAFGERLGEEGYSLTAQEQTEDGLQLTVSRGGMDIILLYDVNAARLQVSYPAGTVLEKRLPDVFRGYTVVEFGETFSIPGRGEFTLDKLFMGEETPIQYSEFLIGKKSVGVDAECYLTGEFKNTVTTALNVNQIARFTLYYINEDNAYSYRSWFTSLMEDKGVFVGYSNRGSTGLSFNIDTSWPFTYYNQPQVPSLTVETFAAVFPDVPELVQSSDDGMLAVTIAWGDARFVVVDRY